MRPSRRAPGSRSPTTSRCSRGPTPTPNPVPTTDMPRRRLLVLALLVPVVLAAAGCGNVASTGAKGYIDGDGVITVLPPAQRKQPGTVSGKTLEGTPISLASYAGKVVVINVWGAWCPACRAQASDLAAAARALAPQGV